MERELEEPGGEAPGEEGSGIPSVHFPEADKGNHEGRNLPDGQLPTNDPCDNSELTARQGCAEHELEGGDDELAHAGARGLIAEIEKQVSELTEKISQFELELSRIKNERDRFRDEQISKLASVEGELQDLQEKHREASRQIAQLEQEKLDLIQAHENEKITLRDKISALSRSCTRVLEDYRSLAEEKRRSLEQQCDTMTATLQRHEEKETEYIDQVKHLEEEKSKLTESLSQAETQILQLGRKHEELARQYHKEGKDIESQVAECQHRAERQLEGQKVHGKQGALEVHILVFELREVTDWFHFGLHLKVPPYTLKIIMTNHPGDHEMARTNMLMTWRDHEGCDGSWEDIIKALVKIRMQGLAERLAKKHHIPPPEPDDVIHDNSESPQSEIVQLLSEIGRDILEKLREQDQNLTTLRRSIEEETEKRETARKETQSIKEHVEGLHTKHERLAAEEIKLRQRLTSNTQELVLLKQARRPGMQNQQFEATVKRKQEENDLLTMTHKEKEDELDKMCSEMEGLQGRLDEAEEKLQSSQNAVQEKETERANLQEKIDKKRKKAEKRLMVQAAKKPAYQFPTTETERKVEYEEAERYVEKIHDHEKEDKLDKEAREREIVELLAGLQNVKLMISLTSRCHNLQTLYKQAENVEKVAIAGWAPLERGNICLRWRRVQNAPKPLSRWSVQVRSDCRVSTATADREKRVAYFSDGCDVYAFQYDGRQEQWFEYKEDKKIIPQPPKETHECSFGCYIVGVVDDTLTVTSHYYRGKNEDDLYKLVGRKESMKWEYMNNKPDRQRSTALIYSHNHLVIIGGYTARGDMTSDVRTLNTMTWRLKTTFSLPFPIAGASATINEDKIYVFGGYGKDCMSRIVLTCSLETLIESCDSPVAQTPSPWEQVAHCPVYQSTCIAVNGKLYAVGGCDTVMSITDAVYAYNEDDDSWNIVGHMSIPRCACLAVALSNNEIMVVGGKTYNPLFKGDCKTQWVECAVAEICTIQE